MGSVESMRMQMNSRLFAEADNIRRQVDSDAELQTAFSRIGRLGPLRRLSQLLQTGLTETTPINAAIAEALGGIPAAEIQRIGVMPYQKALGAIGEASGAYFSAATAEEKAKAMGELKAATNSLAELRRPFDADTVMRSGMAADIIDKVSRGDLTSGNLDTISDLPSRMLASDADMKIMGPRGATRLRGIQGIVASMKAIMGQHANFNTLLQSRNREALGLQKELQGHVNLFSVFGSDIGLTGKSPGIGSMASKLHGIRISGDVRFIWPNILRFENVDGRGETPAGADRPTH